MAKRQLLHVQMFGSGIHEDFHAVSHVVMPNPGGTYHKFVLPDGETTVFYNDFGVQKVILTPVSVEG